MVDSRLATSIGNLNNAGPINIGQDTTGIYNEAGSADIDDLAIWRRALTAYESYSIYYAATNSNSSFNVPGTVALGISTVGTNIVLTWSPGATLGTLLQYLVRGLRQGLTRQFSKCRRRWAKSSSGLVLANSS